MFALSMELFDSISLREVDFRTQLNLLVGLTTNF